MRWSTATQNRIMCRKFRLFYQIHWEYCLSYRMQCNLLLLFLFLIIIVIIFAVVIWYVELIPHLSWHFQTIITIYHCGSSSIAAPKSMKNCILPKNTQAYTNKQTNNAYELTHTQVNTKHPITYIPIECRKSIKIKVIWT